MRTSALAALLVLLSGGVAQASTFSDSVCAMISRYLDAPPAAFLADRGRAFGLNRWQSTQPLPNFNCFVSLRAGTHRLSCTPAFATPGEESVKLYEAARQSIQECIAKRPDAANFKAKIDDGATKLAASSKWQHVDGSTTFAIILAKTKNAGSFDSVVSLIFAFGVDLIGN